MVLRIAQEKTSLGAQGNVNERIRKDVLRAKENTVEVDADENPGNPPVTKTIKIAVNLCKRCHETQILTADGTALNSANFVGVATP